MFLLKLFYFLKGYVIIDIIGEKGGKLLSLANEKNLRLWNVTPDKAYCMLRDLKPLLCLAREYAIGVKVLKEVSFFGFLQKSLGGIFIGTAVVCLLMAVSAGYVWEIEVNGCKNEVRSEVLEVLQKQGLEVGVKKSTLPDGNTLRDSIIYSVDGINWAWVYFDGTLARVEVSYSPTHEPVPERGEPCNITAVRDGVIVSVSATSGRKCVAVGQTVLAGDILISGAMPGGMLTDPYQVSAEGEVLAQTVYTRSATLPLLKTYTKDTGEQFVRRSLRFFDIELPLGLKKSPDFEEYRLIKHTPPAGICTYRYIGTESVTEPVSTEAAVKEAADSLSEQIAHSLSGAARKTDEELRYEEIGGFVKVTLTMNFIENIGALAPINAWQMEELANDKTD